MLFFKFWLTVGRSVTDEVKKIFTERRMPSYLNQTLIALIPKIQGPETRSEERRVGKECW